MTASEALSRHVRRDTRTAYAYTATSWAQTAVSVGAVIDSLFVAPHNLAGMVLVPLLALPSLIIRPRRRPPYRTRSWRLHPGLRDGTLAYGDALWLLAEGMDDDPAHAGPPRRADCYWWGKQIAGTGLAAAVGLTLWRGGVPTDIAFAAAAVWLLFVSLIIELELRLFISAINTLHLLPEPDRLRPNDS